MTGFALACAVAVSGSVVAAQQKPQIKQTSIQATPETDPKAMFTEYCAACHGPEGKGNGPAAAALKKAPADLTKLSAQNGGKFPEVIVRRYIQGADEVAAHGSRDMPIWGNLLRSLPGGETGALLRVNLLVDYVKSLQK
jgi:mono/diheme cytochrome c family protein